MCVCILTSYIDKSISDMQLHGNDVDARSEVDTAQRKDLRDYTSPVRLLILLSTTLSLWYSVGIGVGQIKTSVCYVTLALAIRLAMSKVVLTEY